MRHTAILLLLAAVACEEGGSTTSPGPMPSVPVPAPRPECPVPASPAAPPSSYNLQTTSLLPHRGVIRRDAGLTPDHDPTNATAVAYGDFDRDGMEDFFVGILDGSPNPRPVEFFRNTGSGYVKWDRIFRGEIPSLVHPRKALAGDFNGDGRLDVFVAGHGYDRPPFPGESPVLILSTPDGRLQDTQDLREHVGFLHGAASADIDLDGDLDIFVTDTTQPFVLTNDGAGRMTYDINRVPLELTRKNLYTVELIDVDEDGFPDLLIAGHEHEGAASAVYWGDCFGQFDAARKTALAAVPGFGVVVDIDAEDLDGDGQREIILTRTQESPWYEGFYLQVLASEDGYVFTDETSLRITGGSAPEGEWVRWLRIQDLNDDGHPDLWNDFSWRPRQTWLNDGNGRLYPGPDLPDRE